MAEVNPQPNGSLFDRNFFLHTVPPFALDWRTGNNIIVIACMKSNNDNEAITTQGQIPVLIRSSKKNCDGRIAVPGETATVYVRILSPDALNMAVSKDKKKRERFARDFGIVSMPEMKHLLYVLSLIVAVHKGDGSRLREAVQRYTKADGDPEYVDVAGMGHVPYFSEEFWREWEDIPSTYARRGEREVRIMRPLWTLHREVNSGIAKVRFVVWWNVRTRCFAPGLWCSDLLSALHTLAMAQITQVGGTTVCLRCGALFRRSRQRQAYCSNNCRAASAMARMRERRRTTTSLDQEEGKHVTRKKG
jgi:hypothetical protein